MYVSPEGDDYDVQINGSVGRALPLVRTRSGHIMLPISGYQGQTYPVEVEDNNRSDVYENSAARDRPNEWEVISAQSLR